MSINMSMISVLKFLKPSVGINNEACRETWLENVLQRIPSNSKILDAGAGTQRYRKYCKHLEYVSQDFGEYDGKGDDSALQMGEFDYGKLDIVSDITSIPMPNSSFDAIMCIEVLEHLPDPVQAIREFSRLLKPNGHLIITAPFCSLTHFAPYHFSSGFNKYWYEKHLTEYEFNNIEIAENGNFFEYLAQEVYRMPYISSRYSNSKPNLIELFSMLIFQRMLLRFSKNDYGSSELLCFGYHIHAMKES
jgi:ubiquinone/menaquinone biosynthesis C-methylase UbiE